jgi:SAM-dependent methyltransferase
MGIARVVMAGQRLGIYRRLAYAPATESALAESCRLEEVGLRHLLRCLTVLGHVAESGGQYALSKPARKWLDPESPAYIGSFLEFNYDQWEWWSGIERSLQGYASRDIHAHGPDDPYWRRYIRAMFELARLSAPEIASRISLPGGSARILDAAGGHGWHAAEICRRNPAAEALVIDLPGSARVGREIIAETGMSERVRHVEGDVMTDDLGGPYDAVLCFQLIHHLLPEQNQSLFKRIAGALKPGGILAVLDYFEPARAQKPDSAAFLGLHFYLTSSATTHAVDELKGWLASAGFTPPRRSRLRTIPLQQLYQCRKQ